MFGKFKIEKGCSIDPTEEIKENEQKEETILEMWGALTDLIHEFLFVKWSGPDQFLSNLKFCEGSFFLEEIQGFLSVQISQYLEILIWIWGDGGMFLLRSVSGQL